MTESMQRTGFVYTTNLHYSTSTGITLHVLQ